MIRIIIVYYCLTVSFAVVEQLLEQIIEVFI